MVWTLFRFGLKSKRVDAIEAVKDIKKITKNFIESSPENIKFLYQMIHHIG